MNKKYKGLDFKYTEKHKFPYTEPEVFKTKNGVPYLKEPGVAVLARPLVDIEGMKAFLSGFPEDLGYMDYLKDPVELPPAEMLSKVAGQKCYMSFGPKRTTNENALAYFTNVNESSHGSIYEHASITIDIWGMSRSVTHDLVRHRAGFGFSQVSQRYVDVLRFVERPEIVVDPMLHERFERWIEIVKEEYDLIVERLLEKQQNGEEILSAERKTDLRKKVRQTARSILPNETEAPIVVTANIRAWRHFLNMRASMHTDLEIRRVAMEIYRCLVHVAPILFSDFEVEQLGDGTYGLKTPYPKV